MPQTSETRALEAPQIPLIITGPAAALDPASPERDTFSNQISTDVALSTGLEKSDVYMSSLEAVMSLDDRNRRALQVNLADLAVIRLPMKAMVTVMTTRPAFIISTLNQQLEDSRSVLRLGNATSYLIEGQQIDAALVLSLIHI